MRKIFALCLVLLTCFFPSFIYAEEGSFQFEEFECYCYEDGTVEISRWNGDEESLIIPDEINGKQVTIIGIDAFMNCLSLREVKLPNSLTEIADCAFFNCAELKEIEIPISVTKIGRRAFIGCWRFTSIEIPDSVTMIGGGAFANCDVLKEVSVSQNNVNYAVIDNVLFDKREKKLVCCPAGLVTDEYSIPEGILTIGNEAFGGCDFTRIVIPNTVTKIEDLGFANCINLLSLELPNSITELGAQAFSNCHSMTSIKIPNSVTSIGPDAFIHCNEIQLIVARDSYAAQYAEENGLSYTYSEVNENDWLNN